MSIPCEGDRPFRGPVQQRMCGWNPNIRFDDCPECVTASKHGLSALDPVTGWDDGRDAETANRIAALEAEVEVQKSFVYMARGECERLRRDLAPCGRCGMPNVVCEDATHPYHQLKAEVARLREEARQLAVTNLGDFMSERERADRLEGMVDRLSETASEVPLLRAEVARLTEERDQAIDETLRRIRTAANLPHYAHYCHTADMIGGILHERGKACEQMWAQNAALRAENARLRATLQDIAAAIRRLGEGA